MVNRIILGVIGAVLLATNGAHAFIDLDSADSQTVKYARETLAESFEKGGTKYYVLTDNMVVANAGTGDAGALDVRSKTGILGSTSSTLVVRYALENMVFSGTSAPTLKGVGSAPVAKTAGGNKGDDSVTFVIRNQSVAADASMTLDLVNIAVAEGGGGTITMTVWDRSFPDLVRNEQSATDIIGFENALEEESTAYNPVASVETDFLELDLSSSSATSTATVIGSLAITVDTALLAADDSQAVAQTDIYDNAQSKVTFTGDLSFVGAVILADSAYCSGGPDILETEGDDATRSLAERRPNEFATVKYLCIEADGETAIPETTYMVTTSYARSGEAVPGIGGASELGRIERDGTAVHIPYLTTSELYNQRLVIVNRGTTDAEYRLEFITEGGVTATPGNDAVGMVAPGERKVLSLLRDEVVTIEGGQMTTAATLTLNSPRSRIDVATVQVNLESGDTDTVKYVVE